MSWPTSRVRIHSVTERIAAAIRLASGIRMEVDQVGFCISIGLNLVLDLGVLLAIGAFCIQI